MEFPNLISSGRLPNTICQQMTVTDIPQTVCITRILYNSPIKSLPLDYSENFVHFPVCKYSFKYFCFNSTHSIFDHGLLSQKFHTSSNGTWSVTIILIFIQCQRRIDNNFRKCMIQKREENIVVALAATMPAKLKAEKNFHVTFQPGRNVKMSSCV